jgi:hypothetical protein
MGTMFVSAGANFLDAAVQSPQSGVQFLDVSENLSVNNNNPTIYFQPENGVHRISAVSNWFDSTHKLRLCSLNLAEKAQLRSGCIAWLPPQSPQHFQLQHSLHNHIANWL